MTAKKYMSADDLFEEEMGEKPEPEVKTKALGLASRNNAEKPPVKKGVKLKAIKAQEPGPKKPIAKHTNHHENYDADEAGSGSGDYVWAMEDSTTDTAKALEAFMGKGDLRKESELNERQIVACSLLLETAGRYKLPRIRNAVHHFLACRVSKDRGSRTEAVNAFTGLVENRKVNSSAELANSLRRGE